MTDAELAYRETLERFGTVIDFDISALDRTGIPVTSCSLAVDGVVTHHGNGYGADLAAAELSGLGELAEGVLSKHVLAGLPTETATRTELINNHGADHVVDPRRLCLPAGCGYAEDQRITWVPAVRLGDQAEVWVPLAFAASEPADLHRDAGRPLITPITNGLGAGLDPLRPIDHGIGEILQRHTNGLRFRALDSRSPVIAAGDLPDRVAALVRRFSELGIEVVIKHAGTAFGSFSCYAMALDDELSDPIRLTGCGEAADPVPETAMTKAVLEYANSRVRKAFCFGSDPGIRGVAPAAYWDGLPAADGESRAIEAMQAWSRLPAERLRELTAPDRAREVPLASVTPEPTDVPSDEPWWLGPLSDQDVITVRGRVGAAWAAKTMITGLEVETLSYGRIGEANARESLTADLDLVRVSDHPQGDHRARVSLTEDAEERLGGPVWFSYARAAEIVKDRYPLYREPPRHSVAVGAASSPGE